MKKPIGWVFYVASRFALVDSRGRTAFTTLLSSLGIAFGVMALIVIISVMNGFQMGYIESILEVSSFHIRIEDSAPVVNAGLLSACEREPDVLSAVPFLEAQTLIGGKAGRQQGSLLRAVPPDIMTLDEGFANRVQMVSGKFSLGEPGSVVLGSELARALGVRRGDTIHLLAVSGGADTDLFAADRAYTVTGIFRTEYFEIDSTFAFISLSDGRTLFGADAPYLYGIKLRDSQKDAGVIASLKNQFPSVTIESWRSYNRAFFGALRIEKNMLFLLVFLIFVVVGVNIFNSMRRSVFERREESSVLFALGGDGRYIQWIFILGGLIIGAAGTFIGLLLGLLITVRINDIFTFAETAVNGVMSFFSLLFSTGGSSAFSLYSPVYFYLTEVPARVLFSEVSLICLFGVLSAAAAAWAASRGLMKLSPAEVLRYE